MRLKAKRGYRFLKVGEKIKRGDLFWFNRKWYERDLAVGFVQKPVFAPTIRKTPLDEIEYNK